MYIVRLCTKILFAVIEPCVTYTQKRKKKQQTIEVDIVASCLCVNVLIRFDEIFKCFTAVQSKLCRNNPKIISVETMMIHILKRHDEALKKHMTPKKKICQTKSCLYLILIINKDNYEYVCDKYTHICLFYGFIVCAKLKVFCT